MPHPFRLYNENKNVVPNHPCIIKQNKHARTIVYRGLAQQPDCNGRNNRFFSLWGKMFRSLILPCNMLAVQNLYNTLLGTMSSNKSNNPRILIGFFS